MNERIPSLDLSVTVTGAQHHAHTRRQTPAQAGGKIHTRSFRGRYRSLRLLIAGALAVMFFGTSWINWSGHQAVLWDLTERKFYVFGTTFFPEDFLLLSFAMCISAFLLLAASVIAGRVWCGYACPQSTWTWTFMWMEKITEGDSYQRVKLDAAPWSIHKFMRRSSKHLLWLAASLATGIAFMGYFMPVRNLVSQLLTAQLDGYYLFWVLFIAGMTYLNAGWLREKVCTHMCPYARFQSAMFDKDTLIIGYDAQRGEGRGSRRKEDDYRAQGLGDCIDCHMCVQVCPTGIDIRDGLQMDCISCAACVDACDSVMEKMGYAPGLVGYTSERYLDSNPEQRLKVKPGIRWNTSFIAYTSAIVGLLAILAFNLSKHQPMELNVLRDRNVMRINALGEKVNVYLLKLTNKTQQDQTYHLELADNDSLYLTKTYALTLAPGERLDLPVAVALKHQVQKSHSHEYINFRFQVTNSKLPEQWIRQSASFIYTRP